MISCVIGHAFQTGGEMSEGWLSGLLFLPITHLVYFFGSMVVLADLNHLWLPLIFILSPLTFFVSLGASPVIGHLRICYFRIKSEHDPKNMARRTWTLALFEILGLA